MVRSFSLRLAPERRGHAKMDGFGGRSKENTAERIEAVSWSARRVQSDDKANAITEGGRLEGRWQ